MIPCSVELTNFLSHRCSNGKPAVFDFEGAVLWSVSGDNGAGKSAIFDGITWTLFGQHRAGTQDAKRLICHGADRCCAAFVFTLAAERYRVERSVTRRGGTRRSASRWDGAAKAWKEIPATRTEKDFATWRDELIGLSYEAFTQSVLLIQGGSDRLIASGAKERFEILAQLVDLSSYQRLEERARDRASEARGERQALTRELEQLPPVDPEERAAAQAELERLSAERDARKADWAAQVAILEGTRAHAGLLERRAHLERQITEFGELLEDAERIREDATERTALMQARPRIEAAVNAREAAAQALDSANQRREQIGGIDVAALEDASQTAHAATEDARGCAADATGSAIALRELLVGLETAVQRRLELLKAEDARKLSRSSAETADALETGRRASAELAQKVEQARNEERCGERALADAAASLQAGERALELIRAGAHEAVCTRCGQTVPPEHRATHLEHLESDIKAKRTAVAHAKNALDPLISARSDAEDAADRARETIAELDAEHFRAAEAERTLAGACDAAAAARRAVEDWDDPRLRVVIAGDRAQLEALRDAIREESAEATRKERRAADAARTAEVAARKLANEVRTAKDTRGELQLQLDRAEQTAANQSALAGIELERVPEAWATRVRDDEPDVVEALSERLLTLEPAAGEVDELDRAEEALAVSRAGRDELTAQIDEVPDEHKVPLPQAQARLAEGQRFLEAAGTLVEGAQGQVRDLDQRDRQLKDRREDLRRAQRKERLATRLAGLLGRQGIQGQLIVRAARDLERLANETLRAISGGTLALEIRAEERRGHDEIVISARDFNCGGERTDASFLSGSEKFRVCVAMAAAIGKYASGQMSIESLIIDEGFGSLDEAGRDEMIDELTQLAQLLKRVVVVSHQLEFQDRARFPHGYKLRREGSVTTVERFV